MWQRIQTVFLVVSIIALLVSLVMPIWMIDVDGQKNVLTPFYLMSTFTGQSGQGLTQAYLPYSITAMFAVASITLSIIEITKYKHRMTQMKIGALNSFFLVGVILSSVYFTLQLAKTMTGTNAQYGLGMWLPGLSVFCNLLANRFIRKDEKLVRDSNRLR